MKRLARMLVGGMNVRRESGQNPTLPEFDTRVKNESPNGMFEAHMTGTIPCFPERLLKKLCSGRQGGGDSCSAASRESPAKPTESDRSRCLHEILVRRPGNVKKTCR